VAYHVRVPNGAVGKLHRRTGAFVTSAPLALHDACAHVPAIAGDPWSDQEGSWAAREAFTAPMGAGFDLCWNPVYSFDPLTAPACYACGEQVLGRC
jgi:hypothetical protein